MTGREEDQDQPVGPFRPRLEGMCAGRRRPANGPAWPTAVLSQMRAARRQRHSPVQLCAVMGQGPRPPSSPGPSVTRKASADGTGAWATSPGRLLTFCHWWIQSTPASSTPRGPSTTSFRRSTRVGHRHTERRNDPFAPRGPLCTGLGPAGRDAHRAPLAKLE